MDCRGCEHLVNAEFRSTVDCDRQGDWVGSAAAPGQPLSQLSTCCGLWVEFRIEMVAAENEIRWSKVREVNTGWEKLQRRTGKFHALRIYWQWGSLGWTLKGNSSRTPGNWSRLLPAAPLGFRHGPWPLTLALHCSTIRTHGVAWDGCFEK